MIKITISLKMNRHLWEQSTQYMCCSSFKLQVSQLHPRWSWLTICSRIKCKVSIASDMLTGLKNWRTQRYWRANLNVQYACLTKWVQSVHILRLFCADTPSTSRVCSCGYRTIRLVHFVGFPYTIETQLASFGLWLEIFYKSMIKHCSSKQI